MAISVPITAVVTVILTAIVFSLICYCIRSKGSYSPSPVTAHFPLATTTVSTSGVTSYEMKDNMAYGHSGRPTTTSDIYENIIT